MIFNNNIFEEKEKQKVTAVCEHSIIFPQIMFRTNANRQLLARLANMSI